MRSIFLSLLLLLFTWQSSFAAAGAINIDRTHEPLKGLAAALNAAMTYNPAIKGKQAEVATQSYAIDTAKAARYPTLSAQANNVSDGYDQGIVRLQQPLWAFGKIDTEIQHAEQGFSAEQQTLLQVQRQLIENTAVAYAQVEGVQKRLQVAQLNIDEHDQLYQQIKRRAEGHLASEVDVRLAYSRLIQTRSQRIRLQGELQVALTELHALTQQPVAAQEPVDTDLLILPPLQTIESLALEKSAEVRFKQAQLELVRLEVKAEKLATMPTLSYRVDHEFLDHSTNGDRTTHGFVIEGNLDGLGLRTLSLIKGANSRQRAAREGLNVARNDIRRRVNALAANRQMQMLLSESQRESIEVVESTLASFIRQYESGRKSWIDVLNTQRELTELRFQLVQSEHDRLSLSLRLAALTGGLDLLAGIEL